LIRADAFKYLPTMPVDSVDCAPFSPPYWDIIDYNGNANLYGNEKVLAGYRANTRLLCRGLYPVVKQTGSLWAVVGYKREAGRLIDLPALWAEDAESEGFILKQKIIWDKQNTVANGHTSRERDTHEVILHLTKKKAATTITTRQRACPTRTQGRPRQRASTGRCTGGSHRES
jgi:DNA modification methylase